MSDNLQRRTTEAGRVYTDMEELFLPSVTTVIDQKPEPKGLKYWKQKYDGTGGNEHWRDILSYKANRGTMIHYNLLNEFAPEDMFGRNEEDSTEELKLEGNWERYREELTFAQEAWKEIKEIRGIDAENVLDVECFVTNTGIGYAGQFDLLYIDKNGDLVLSDLKTSKRVYDKHQMQLIAYDNALSLDIDVLEVVRIHPDSESWEISHDSDWSKNRNEIWGEFVSLRQSMTNVEEEFKKIADEGVDDG
ncbi:PD-(D/E)XK nuclease [Halogranum tailed virus 1]|uniref:PD-(D/E)XK nuclease n=1 Tax=Halogranum tailed virus 1 TaxID=1273749 RepID=R4T6P3_9CAUD|nr:PD-(D/E)XK nuclease [Halogranum tailed virus 1]AGM11369.1 PD-(D/E)XK nuclease [Halogranum tailed virus 1]